MAENAKWLDSIEGKTYQFTNALETMWSNMLDSEVVKGFIDFGTKAIQFLDTTPGKITAIVAALAGIAKFKGFSILGLGQDALKDFNNIKSAYSTLKMLNTVTPVSSLDAQSVSMYAAAVSNLTAKQQANLLASQGLSKAQIQLAMQYNNLSDDVIREATAHVFAKTSTEQEAAAETSLFVAKAQNEAARLRIIAASASETTAKQLNAAASILESGASKEVVLSKLQEALTSGQITPAIYNEIAAKLGLITVNKTLGASFKALFASNPVGMILTLATTILSVAIPAIEHFHVSAKELKEEVEELKNTYEDAKKTFSDNLTELTTSSDIEVYATLEDEFKRLTQGVDQYGNNLSLTSDQYERYKEICEKIVGINPKIASGYDSATQAIGNNASALSQLIELQKQQARQNVKDLITNENLDKIATDAYNDVIKKESTYEQLIGTKKYFDEQLGLSFAVNAKDNGLQSAQITILNLLQELGYDPQNIRSILDNYLLESGDYNLSQFFTDYIDEIYANKDTLSFTDTFSFLNDFFDGNNGDLINYSKWMQENAANIQKYQDLFEESKDGFINTLLQVPFGEEAYDKLDDSSKNAIVEWIKNSEIFKIDPDATEDELQNQLEDNVETIQKLVNGFADESIQAAVNGISDLDKSSLTARDYGDQVQGFLTSIWDAIGGVDNEYGFSSKQDLGKMFGIDVNAEMEKIDKAYGTLAAYLETSRSDISSAFNYNTMTQEEMETFLGIDWNAIGAENVKSAKDVWKLIHDALKNNNVISVKTYSTLSEDIANYNEVLKQTEEIVTDNTEVTQEYKDALKELGISEKDLNECFDENNKLLVKDAGALNRLVKDTKKSTAQNIKLAKSQARLEYYEKFKELQKLTNGKKVETVATLNQVKAIYAEMAALQKSISRYSMLEHQLLGATNAYEEFAKAQEIDEANDYETKAENLVGYLVDAFQTAKLGTESAQAAIKGLVPESVYEDLDTLDDKMAAVYKYFTEDLSDYFYVKFNDDGSLESAEMLVDNIKKFVEDGIGKGVFTGSWEEWDLDSSISTLEDLTQKMGVTKEVAYAFLQAMETYDISWIGGDASTLLDKLIPTTAQITTVKEQIQEAFNQTPIDLTARLNVSAEKLEEQGHASYSSTFDSSEFGLYNEDGSSYQILATPVLPNGDILGPDEMADYINKQLASGKSIEEVDIFVGSYKIKEEAEEARKILDESIKHYQNIIKNYSLENAITTNAQKRAELQYKIGTGEIDADTVVSADGKTTAQEQLAQLNEEAEANARAARENATEWTEAKNAYDEAAEAVKNCNKELANANKINDPDKIADAQAELEKAEKTMWNTYDALSQLSEPTEVTLTVAKEQVEKDLAEVKATMNETEVDLVSKLNISNLEKENGKWVVPVFNDIDLDQVDMDKIQKYLDYLAEEHNINVLQSEGAVTTLDVLSEIKDILSQTYELMVQTSDAEEKTKTFSELWNGITDKTVTLWQDFKQGVTSYFTRTPKEAEVDGTAHVGGTAFAGGSWGAPKTETALTGELGPEILVRNGKWTTVGENGAEFTQIKKGDIIFNHKQSEQLLKHGYVTGRGKAYAGGTAYAGAVHPWLGGMGNIDNDWQNITPTLWNTATNGEYLADSLKDAADSVNEFEETIDWIEIRMEELDESLSLLNAHLENASTYSDKNDIIENMIEVNGQIYKNAQAGAEYYQKHANKYLEGMSKELVDAAKDGSIAITEFTKESDEATVKAIQNYRDFAQKAADLTQQAVEKIAEIRDLYIQKIDNAEHSGKVKADVEASQTEKLQNAVDFDETRGLITDPNYYAAMMENSERTIAYLTTARNNMQKEFDQAVRDGQLIVGDDNWYEQLNKLYQIDAEIDEANAELEEFQNAINDIYWEAFDELIARFDYISEETQGLIDLMSELDMVSKPDNDAGWNADDVEWTKEGLATLGLHAQELERAEEKAKAYAVAIDELTAEYKAGHYSESEYYEKLNELTQGQYDAIKAAQEEKEAIVELNEARVDAIKEGIEKEIEAYEKLIDKKKEELETEKDLHDFQKGVAEQQKSIADIQRKLAALSADSSASAIAKRKQLEAELIEAQAALEETYYDRSIENQQNALDKELEYFQEEKDAEIEKWEKYLEDVETVVTESLNIVQANATEIGNTLTEKTQEYNLTVSDAVLSPWRDGVLAIDEYTTKFGDSVSSTTAQLDTIRAKWQEVKEELAAANVEADKYYSKQAATASGPSVAEINKENANYIKATKTPTPAPAPSTNNNKNNNTSQAKAAPSVGGTVTVKKTATNFSSKSGNARMASFVPGGSYTVYQVDGNQILIGRNGVYTGWVNKTDLQGYAKGAISVDEDQFAWLDELGEELQFVPGANGRLEYVKKGTGIVPADLTKRLIDLAMNPQEMLDRNRPQITPSKSVINNNMEFNVDASVGTLLHVDHLDGNNPDEVIKIVDKAWEKKMQGLNSAIKRFTR